jgi:hypothetical protein
MQAIDRHFMSVIIEQGRFAKVDTILRCYMFDDVR